MDTVIAPQIHQYLSVSASQAGLTNALQQNISPIAQGQAAQYLERNARNAQSDLQVGLHLRITSTGIYTGQA
jgi:hypothetical protein